MNDRLKPMRETVRDELEIPQALKGTNQHTGACDNVTLTSDRGNSASYTLRRLKRDRPDLAEAFYDRLDALPDEVWIEASQPGEHELDDEVQA